MSNYNDKSKRSSKTHLDSLDRSAREALARELGVDGERIDKAVSMVGTRITSIRAYLAH